MHHHNTAWQERIHTCNTYILYHPYTHAHTAYHSLINSIYTANYICIQGCTSIRSQEVAAVPAPPPDHEQQTVSRVLGCVYMMYTILNVYTIYCMYILYIACIYMMCILCLLYVCRHNI